MSESQHILVVDDDRGIRNLLSEFLQEHGFRATLAENGSEMRAALAEHQFDLIILDIMMPGEDGLTLCRELRSRSNVPIILLTAIREEVERILGLEMGADDYLSKPFNPRELLARIKAILRRSHSALAQNQADIDIAELHFCGWVLQRISRRLLSPEQMEISLSSGEYNLLLAFLECPQVVLSRDELAEMTKRRNINALDRSIDIQISRLRYKIEEDPKKPKLIQTVRGGGYVFAAPVQIVTVAG